MLSTEVNSRDAGVYDLLTELCTKTASKYCTQSRISQKRLVTKMRSHAYEIILKKSPQELSMETGEPISDLLTYYFVSYHNAKNVSQYRNTVNLKKIISTIRKTDFGDSKDHIYNVLRFLIALRNSIKEDCSFEIFQKPFTFGVLNDMLPKPKRESFGSPQPYPYYPSHIFELPFSLRKQGAAMGYQKSQTYTEYTVESFNSKSFLVDANITSQTNGSSELKTFLSPMSLASMTSTHLSPYPESGMFNYSRLSSPRDLQIPNLFNDVNIKISEVSTNVKTDVKEVFRASNDEESVDIWELAAQVDKDVPDNIWEIVSKMPPIHERQLIASSPREMALWREIYGGMMSDLRIVSEKQFIRHIMYLIIGVETNSFPFNEEMQCFEMKENLVMQGISKEHIRGYISDLLLIGTYYRRLYNFAFNQTLEDHFYSNGLVYEAAREVIRCYLLEFRLLATEIYEECTKSSAEDINCMPTLLQILYHLEPLKYEIETIVSIYKMIDTDPKTSIPRGAELMSYLFSEISLVTHKKTAFTMFNSLVTICKVYFKFIERFIFEGELDDRYDEFFIRKDSQYVNCRSKRYWDKGFHITQSVAIPEFLKTLAKCILLCGKSLRLLKLCNPSDPLVLLISSDHPSVKCCASFDELERQQQVLDVYRTRCLFVSGELVTFDQILLKREAERKAFTEMASLKQAETLEKIVAERKRLAQLIIAEKQHSLRVLEAAMAEAKAAKNKAKKRERMRSDLQEAAQKATDELDSKLRDVERTKIMEYYCKLNMEVEKSKIHTEWKIKRLQLDQSRMQLLSSEERNLKREKLELEHQKNEEMMAMSTQSIEMQSVDGLDSHDIENVSENKIIGSNTSIKLNTVEDAKAIQSTNFMENKLKANSSKDVFIAICNVAKGIFGVSKSTEIKACDNKKELDFQGNILDNSANNTERNRNLGKTSSDIIGAHLNDVYDNEQYYKTKQEAILNKQKVMAHEFGQIDNENNPIKYPPIINIASVDIENNIGDWTPFMQAKKNKMKILGAEFGIERDFKPIVTEPKTEAQREALLNKQKVLGVEYNSPLEIISIKEPANIAQEEALRNKKKILTSDCETNILNQKREVAKRSGLTLNLKPYSDTVGGSQSTGTTPNTGGITPGEFYSKLDLETPTTAEVPLEGAITSEIFTAQVEDNKELDIKKSNKEFLNSNGFNFSVVVDEEATESEITSDIQTLASPDNSPMKSLEEVTDMTTKYSFFNLLDGSYNLEDFDPFGVRELKKYSKDYFTKKMDFGISYYTHPAIIMEEVQKQPYNNIFTSHYEEKENKITCDNIATLTACLQRSVMLPLTYQLEVVNNSILTYFLINLDMYDHMKSLKDYFFLMDGEFSRSICRNLFTKLAKTLNPQELLNYGTLHNILDKALGSSISHVLKFSENLSFTITESPLSLQHSSPDVLQCLSLTYSVNWPLNIILSQEALLRYAKVFQFLIKMRRIFWVLGEDFESLKLSAKLSREHSRKFHRSPQYISIQIYRHIMASMIRALDNYIVTTCIQSSWTEFENDLKKARTLDDLYECHMVYLKKVLFRCLLNNRSTPVMKLLNDIFTVVLKFSRVLKAGEWHQNEPNGIFTHSSYVQLEELFHLFEKLAKYLHKVVTKLMECGYQRHLVELLTMVNLNGYYDPERSKEEHNTSVQSP